jgi:small subunit ribosomal protein S1
VSAFGKRIGHPSEVVKPGDEIAVRVDGVDAEARRVSLQLVGPMEGEVVESPGPASGLRVLRRASATPSAPEQGAGAGEGARDREDPGEGEPARAERPPMPKGPGFAHPRVGDVFEVSVDRVETYGLFVSWPTGRGLLPGRELGLPRETDLRRKFPLESKLRAAVLDIREDGKITLSAIAVEKAEERATTDDYMKRSGASQGRGLGTLADLMDAKKRR